jgi:hypothetical protein
MAATTYDLIASQTLGSAAASITFSSIPSTYTDLRIVFSGTGATVLNLKVRFNGDSASNYSQTNLQGLGTGTQSTSPTNQTEITASGATALSTTIPGLEIFDIFSYASSTYKTTLLNCNQDKNGSGTVEATVALWRSTAAITSVALFVNTTMNIGTTAQLYGIRAA